MQTAGAERGWHCRALQPRAAFRAEKEEDVTQGTPGLPSPSLTHLNLPRGGEYQVARPKQWVSL